MAGSIPAVKAETGNTTVLVRVATPELECDRVSSAVLETTAVLVGDLEYEVVLLFSSTEWDHLVIVGVTVGVIDDDNEADAVRVHDWVTFVRDEVKDDETVSDKVDECEVDLLLVAD